MPIQKLPLPDGQRTQIFRQIEAFLKNDASLGRVFRADAWKTFAGNPNDASELAPIQGPSIRLYPAPGPMAWATPDSMLAPLYINIDCCVPGLIADDVLNLQDAIERAIYPLTLSGRIANVNTLQALGAQTGLVEFSMPIHDPAAGSARSGNWYTVGQLRIDIRRSLNV